MVRARSRRPITGFARHTPQVVSSLWVDLLLLSLLVGCGKNQSERASPDNSASPRKGSSFSALLQPVEQVVESKGMGFRPTDETVQSLLEAARKEGISSSATPEEDLLVYLADRKVGLVLYDRLVEKKGPESDTGSPGFCRRIFERSPTTPVGAIALDDYLEAAEKGSGDGFLEECTRVIEENPSARATAVALRQRADHFCAKERFKEASADYLFLWADFPQRVSEMSLRRRVIDCLLSAGLALESQILADACAEESPGYSSDSPEGVVRFLVRDFFPESAGPTQRGVRGEGGLTGEYWNLTPDVERLLKLPIPDDTGPADRALFEARVATLRAFKQPTTDVLGLFDEYRKLVGRVLQAGSEDPEALLALSYSPSGVVRTVARCLEATSYCGQWIPDSPPFTSKKGIDFLSEVSRLGLELAAHVGIQDPTHECLAFAALKRHVSLLKAMNDRRNLVGSYEYVTSRFPDSERTSESLLELATVFKETLKTDRKALQVYEDILARAPDSKAAETARVRMSVLLFEMGRHDEAYLSCQEALAAYPDGANAPSMRYLSALCESAMGLDDDARAHMMELVRLYPTNEIAPRALFWLASNRLSSQDYEAAQEVFQDLIDRFPKSRYSANAKEYLARLSRLSEDKGR